MSFDKFLVAGDLALASGNEADARVAFAKLMSLVRRSGYVTGIGTLPTLLARACAFALEMDIDTDTARAIIQRHRLSPPRDAQALVQWPFPLKLHTLGGFSVLVDDKPLKFSGKSQKKPLELLRALVAFGGREVSEAKLAEALWPDAEGDVASQSLATTLHRLRKLIGENTIERQEGRLSLDAGTVWVDTWAFERNLAELEQACQMAEAGKLQTLTTRLFTLYRGPFLKDEPDAPWLLHLRERLRAKFLRHLEAAAGCLGEAKRHDQAVACYEKAIEIEPLAEGLYRGLMQAHLARGHRAEALAVYGRCRRILTTQLGITPSLDTEALARRLALP
jgi:LuxR family transcriptional regulator, maltose regulon positive regulatory protein